MGVRVKTNEIGRLKAESGLWFWRSSEWILGIQRAGLWLGSRAGNLLSGVWHVMFASQVVRHVSPELPPEEIQDEWVHKYPHLGGPF